MTSGIRWVLSMCFCNQVKREEGRKEKMVGKNFLQIMRVGTSRAAETRIQQPEAKIASFPGD